MRFKEFMIQEVGTSTGDIAGFSRISIPLTRRMWPSPVNVLEDDSKKKSKSKTKMQPQVQEAFAGIK